MEKVFQPMTAHTQVLECEQITHPTEIAIMAVLIKFTDNKTGIFRRSKGDIARKSRVNETTVWRHMERLQKMGMFMLVKEHGGRKTRAYRMIVGTEQWQTKSAPEETVDFPSQNGTGSKEKALATLGKNNAKLEAARRRRRTT